jgi:hypothetical protein
MIAKPKAANARVDVIKRTSIEIPINSIIKNTA